MEFRKESDCGVFSELEGKKNRGSMWLLLTHAKIIATIVTIFYLSTLRLSVPQITDSYIETVFCHILFESLYSIMIYAVLK